MRVIDILRVKGSDVATIGPESTVEEAGRMLADRGYGALVVTVDHARVDGIIFERDVVRHLASAGRDGFDTPVTEVMTVDLRTCRPDDSVEELARVMTETRLRHIPVIDDTGICGIISIGDVVKRRLDDLEAEREQLHTYIQTGR
jgi:CBS domain-containing protein